jgi:glycosyltransferase involved in cell wall biosynthesis
VFFVSDAFDDAVEHPQPGVTVFRYSSRARWRSMLRPKVLIRLLPRVARLLRLGLGARGAVAGALASDMIDEVVRRERIDVVSPYMLPPAFYLAARAQRSDVPTVLNVLGELYDLPHLRRQRRLIRRVLALADTILSPSKYCANSVSVVGGDASRIHVLTLGVDIRKFAPDVDPAPLRDRLDIRRDSKVILFLGRFDDEMGISSALACVDPVLTTHADAVFLFAGASGARTGDVRATAARWRGRVIVQENIPSADVPMCLRLATLLLAPSKPGHPCCGMAIKEALASGTPVVATRTGGHPEVIDDEKTGFLVDVGADGLVDSASLQERIAYVLEHHDGIASMRHTARQAAVERYDARETAAAMERHFVAAVAARDTPRSAARARAPRPNR